MRNGLAVIIGKMRPKAGARLGPMTDDVDDGEGDDGREVAAQDIIDAVRARDAAGLSEALTAFVDLCLGSDDAEE